MSDHNPLFSTFNLSYDKQVNHSNRREQFNMKNKECQEAFRLETENTNKFTDVFAKSEPFEVKALKFQRCLKQTVQKCFRKIRVRGNERETEVGTLLKRKSKLNIFLQSSQCEKSIKMARKNLSAVENKIQELSSTRNVHLVEDYVKSLECNGKFSQSGMWKLRKKLHPSKQLDPPMAKHDKGGNLITAPSLIKKLYSDTYSDRLSHRELKEDFSEVYDLKMQLWERRFELLKLKKSQDWSISDVDKVLKRMKNNKSRDPHGFINEIFKPGVGGSNLRLGILHLANGVKDNFHFPGYMQWANITTIFKNSGSRLSLDNDRGIFVLSVLKKIIDLLIYNDKYDAIDSNMSDSNIG